MAFDPAGWSPDSRPTGVRIHTYVSADAIADVNTSAYFNAVSDTVRVGDVIVVRDSATPTCTLTVVMSNSSGTVNVSNGTAVDVTTGD